MGEKSTARRSQSRCSFDSNFREGGGAISSKTNEGESFFVFGVVGLRSGFGALLVEEDLLLFLCACDFFGGDFFLTHTRT